MTRARRRTLTAECDAMECAAARRVPAYAMPTFRATLTFRRLGLGAWPAQQWLATRTGLTIRTVRRHQRVLQAAGVLDVERSRPHHDPATGQWRRRTNRYRCRFAPRTESKNRNRPAPRGRPPAPTGHACPDNVLREPSDDPAAAGGAVSGQVVPTVDDDERRTCPTCGGPTPLGRWRCDACQARVDERRDKADRRAAAIAAQLRAKPDHREHA